MIHRPKSRVKIGIKQTKNAKEFKGRKIEK
jgi:hypothetical protein